jgi:hypothetical protein
LACLFLTEQGISPEDGLPSKNQILPSTGDGPIENYLADLVSE